MDSMLPARVHGRTAFTFIELLLVVAVIGIAAMLVLPSTGGREDAKLVGAAKMAIADFDYARLHSLGAAADRCVIVFDASGSGYWLARASSPSTPMTDTATNKPYVRVFGQGDASALAGVIINPVNVGADHQLGFTSLGRIDQPTDAHVTLNLAGRTAGVVISAVTGEPSLVP
jgi:prepilin-type N-terminal cleavage/methylation domain-containing protein